MKTLLSNNLKKQHSVKTKKILKPWGWERWIAHGPGFAYVLKELHIKKGCRLSLQFHQFKQETSIVQQGKGILHYSSEAINPKKFVNSKYTPEEIRKIVKDLKKRVIKKGSIFHTHPCFIHRVEATEDLWIIESSTPHLEDIFRLQDDFGRQD